MSKVVKNCYFLIERIPRSLLRGGCLYLCVGCILYSIPRQLAAGWFILFPDLVSGKAYLFQMHLFEDFQWVKYFQEEICTLLNDYSIADALKNPISAS